MKQIALLVIFIATVFSCKPPEARRPVSSSSGTAINQSIERNRDLVANEEAMIKDIISKDPANNYIASSNGFWYYVLEKDITKTRMPQFGDVVEFDFNIKDLNGNVIYSEAETPTKTYAMDQEQLASGIREGLKLMTEGERIVLLLPSHKAYGYYGDKGKIGRSVPIKVELKLNSITTQNKKEE